MNNLIDKENYIKGEENNLISQQINILSLNNQKNKINQIEEKEIDYQKIDIKSQNHLQYRKKTQKIEFKNENESSPCQKKKTIPLRENFDKSTSNKLKQTQIFKASDYKHLEKKEKTLFEFNPDLKEKIDNTSNYNLEENFKKLEFLGCGGYSNVFRGYNIFTGDLVAIKIFKEINLMDVQNEHQIMTFVESINQNNRFIKYHGLFNNSQGLNSNKVLIMESGEISLEDILQFRNYYKLENLLYLFLSLLKDYIFLEENGIFLGDIKPSNVILIQNKENQNLFDYKISDFGSADKLEKSIKEQKLEFCKPLTIEYAAPELKNGDFQNDYYNPFKADVYSFAIMIIELLGFTQECFEKEKNHILYDIICEMILNDPNERIDFAALLIKVNSLIEKEQLIVKQPDDEKYYINLFKEDKLKEELNNEDRIYELINNFSLYKNVALYKTAEERIFKAYDIYQIENKNFQNSLLGALLLIHLAEFYEKIKGDFDLAEDFYLKSKNLYEENLGYDHIETIKCYNNLALFYLFSKINENNADIYLIKTKEIAEIKLEKNNLFLATIYNNLAVFLILKKDFKKSEEYFLKSLEIYIYNDFNEDLPIIYNNLALCCIEEKNYDKSEEYYKKSIKIIESIRGFYHPSVLMCYKNIALLYRIKENYENSEKYYLQCLKIINKIYENNKNCNEKYEIYFILGEINDKFNRNEKAEEYYLKCFSISLNIEQLQALVLICQRIAIFYVKLLEFSKSEHYFELYLANNKSISEKNRYSAEFYNVFGEFYLKFKNNIQSAEIYFLKSANINKENEKLLAETYIELAKIYYLKADFEKTENYYCNTIKIFEKIYGKTNSKTILAYIELAKIYMQLKPTVDNIKKAEDYLLNAEVIYKEQLFESDHIKIGEINKLLGYFYRCFKKNYFKAEKYYLKSLEIYKIKLGKKHYETSFLYNNIGLLYDNKQEFEKAEKYFLKCMKIQEDPLSSNDFNKDPSIYNNLAMFYQKRKKYDMAEKYHKKNLEIHERIFGKEHERTELSYNNIALFYELKEEYNEAEKYFLQSIKINEKSSVFHTNLADNYNNIAALYQKMKKYDEAENYFIKSLELNEKIKGYYHESTAITYNNIALFYTKITKYTKAEKYYLKTIEISEKINHSNINQFYYNLAVFYLENCNNQSKGFFYLEKAENSNKKIKNNNLIDF